MARPRSKPYRLFIKETKGLAGERTTSGAAAVAKQTFQYASVGSNTRSAEKTPE